MVATPAATAAPAPGPSPASTPSPTPPYNWHLPPGFPTPAVPTDNPMSEAKVALGRRLFFDSRLSITGRYSCASCHQPSRAFSDGRPAALGATGQTLPRSAMALVNVAYNISYGWTDPGVQSLEGQMRQPLLNEHPVELGLAGREQALCATLSSDPDYKAAFAESFPGEAGHRGVPSRDAAEDALPPHDAAPGEATPGGTVTHDTALGDAARGAAAPRKATTGDAAPGDVAPGDPTPVSLANIIKAIAAFERTLISGRSPFDQYVFGAQHDAISPAAKRGMALFYSSSAGCGSCHSGFNFDGNWRDAQGATGKPSFASNGTTNTLLRVPTLRNIALTAPYMHDGRFTDLAAVLEHYAQVAKALRARNTLATLGTASASAAAGTSSAVPSAGPAGVRTNAQAALTASASKLRNFNPSSSDRSDLIEFLNTLTDEEFSTRYAEAPTTSAGR
jgi:cytochrome c peroxidase